MANCVYILGNKTFNSEIELDDYLSQIKELYKKYGDEVFSKTWTPIQQTYRERIFNQKEAVDRAIKNKQIEINSSENDMEDLDGISGKFPNAGVSDFIKELRNSEGGLIFPLFKPDEYWNHVRKELKEGDFTQHFKDYVPYIFEQNADGTYNTHPIESDEEFKQVRQKIESIWKQQGLIGTVVHDIFDIFQKNYENKSLDESEIKKILESDSNAYKKLLKDFNNDITTNDTFIKNVIDRAIEFNEELKKQFGDNLMVIPEVTIRGAAIIDNKGVKITGRMDLLVITPEGEINIIDYKCSPKPYNKYDDAKKLTFEYQLAVYRRILQQLGLNSEKGIRLWTVPVQFKDFGINENKVTLSGIKFRDTRVFEELPNSNSTINAQRYDTIENNLDNAFKSEYVEDVSADQVLSKTKNWIARVFPQYASITEVTDENVAKYLEKRKVYNEETDTWGYKRYKNGDLLFPNCKTEAELVSKVKKEWLDNRNRNLDRVKDLKIALKNSMSKNLGRSASFSVIYGQKDANAKKTPDWAQQILQRYANTRYEVVSTQPAYDALGLILIRDKYTDRIDIIKVSSTYDLDASLSFGNERKTLLGNYMTDQSAKNLPESLVMQATRGNIELMETMYALNCLPTLFNNGNGFIGDIQVISPYNEGGGANNKSLAWNFSRLMQLSSSKENSETDYFSYGDDNKPIKMASFLQLAQDSLHRILYFRETDQRWANILESANQLDLAFGNKEKILNELYHLKEKLETQYNNLLSENINTSVYDDYTNPEIRLYAEVMLAIGEFGGLKYTQQTKDHANYVEGNIMRAMLWDGFNGNLTDNPGTLRSETLNQASHLVDVAYQNIRDQLFKYKNEVESDFDNLKSTNGRFDQEKLYRNLYDESVTDDLIFKNPFTNPDLNDDERKVLKKVLLDITRRRKKQPSMTIDELEIEIENNPNTLLVPLIERSGKPVTKSLGNFFGNLRDFFVNLSPKNWKSEVVDKLNEAVAEEEKDDIPSTIWQFTNDIDASKNPEYRKDMIARRGLENFEFDLEMIALKHEYAYIQKNEVDKILPMLKALSIHLANQGIILNDKFENDLSYIQNFIRAKIQNKTIENLQSLGKSKELVNDLMQTTSILALAFNPKQLYQILDGLWKDIRLVIQYDDFTFQDFKDSFFWVIQDVMKGSELSVAEGLNQLYGINDMDINALPSRYAKDTFGTDRLYKAMFRFASRPDFYNRMTIFGAQMRSDGCFEAHSVKDGKLIYDWSKDKRFDLVAKYGGDESKVPSSELKKYREQKSLYYTMAKEMVQDGTLNDDGTKFVLDFKNPKPLPKAYTVRQSESMKSLGDKIYGYYASEKKSLIQAFTLGAMIFQMNTFWSSKKNQYLSGRGFTQEGRWENYEEPNPEDPESPTKYFYKYNEETGELDITNEDTGVPVKVWKGNPTEGIVITLNHLVYDFITGRRDSEGQSLADMYWKNNDPYLRRMYKANLRQLIADLIGMLVIGLIIGPSLVNAANDYAKSIGGDTIETAIAGGIATLGAGMVDQSGDDFFALKSVFGRGAQWTPFSIQSGGRLLTSLGKTVYGDTDMYDTVVQQTAFARNTKPVFNWIKMNFLGRPIGDNGVEIA